ncbi:MAG: flagellin lysine-N-methylase [Oscillibacter sp.]|nr:flagellin lysine-N-methylase [Oscillibacter sp.]
MLVRVPDYYHHFRCLADRCPHSCCEKWEVVLDTEHVNLYESISGPLGSKLRAAMVQDAEGDVCFALNGNRCPFWDHENLCEIHRQMGEAATSVTCQEHPRFTEDFGPFREITLSASCPAANDLLLGSEAPLRFVEWADDAPAENGDDWLPFLLPLRQQMLDILQDRSHSFYLRLYSFLTLAEQAQTLLDAGMESELPNLTADWTPPASVNGAGLFPAALHLLDGLEILEADWRNLLHRAETIPPADHSSALLERIAVYFAFRYLLKCVNDGDLLSRAQLVVFAVLTVEQLAAVCGLSEALRRFSCEIEHNEENVSALLEAFCYGEAFSLPRFFQTLVQ